MPICGKNMQYMLFAEICEKSATCEICSNRIICIKMTCLSNNDRLTAFDPGQPG